MEAGINATKPTRAVMRMKRKRMIKGTKALHSLWQVAYSTGWPVLGEPQEQEQGPKMVPRKEAKEEG